MRILVTAGNTQTPIDRVRCLTNIFTGRTGSRIAWTAYERGHDVCLLTSHLEVLSAWTTDQTLDPSRWRGRPFTTFDDLQALMAEEISQGRFDVVIHAAAVSDYTLAGIYAPAPETTFQEVGQSWQSKTDRPRLLAVGAGKVKSNHAELWLRFVPTTKLVDLIRSAWGFRGVLVKFKLEVGLSDEELVEIAERSRLQSAADLMVANTLEGKDSWALVGPMAGHYEKVPRSDLAIKLLTMVEALQSSHGG